MALDLGLTTRQLLSALDDVALASRTHAQRLNDTLARGLNRSADAAARRTAAVGRRPYISARTGPEGLLGSRPPPEVPQDWTALSVDGAHIDVDRHLPLRCHLTNLGGCVITCGKDFGCQLFSEPALAVADADLYLRKPDDPSDEVLIAGPLLGALRTVLEVERLADAVEQLPPMINPHWPCWTAPWPSGTCSGATIPDTWPSIWSDNASRPLWPVCGLRPPTGVRWPRPPTPHGPEPPRGPAPCASCSAARTMPTATVSAAPAIPTLTSCDGAAGFDDRELFELLLDRDTARPCTGPATWRPASPWDWPPARREPLLLPQRRRRDRLRRGPRLAGRGL